MPVDAALRAQCAGQGHDGVVRFHGVEPGLAPSEMTRVLRDLRAKDAELFEHGHRVAVYAQVLGRELGLKDGRLAFLTAAAWLHDLGKLHIPHAIRFKPGQLTPEEYKVMQLHPRFGARILRSMGAEGYARVALHHHEWYTGWGYPFGLNASELSVETQITSVADAYDAMTCGRCYREALSHDCAIAEIARFSGIQFSPEVVQALVARTDRIEELNQMMGSRSPSISETQSVLMVAAG